MAGRTALPLLVYKQHVSLEITLKRVSDSYLLIGTMEYSHLCTNNVCTFRCMCVSQCML